MNARILLSVAAKSVRWYNGNQCQSNLSVIPEKKFQLWVQPQGFETGISVRNTLCYTLSQTGCGSKVPLILRRQNVATWYSCGPTVYDSPHIGHACSYVKLDIIRRILNNFFDIDTVIVLGITDIDDKIIHKAQQSGVPFQQISVTYENEFHDMMRELCIQQPAAVTRVTNFIPQIIHFVQLLVDKGLGYVSKEGSIYFDTTKYGSYGKFHPELDKTELDVEITESDAKDKRSVRDFALWKASKPGQPWWESPWGKGRPGWHIECSVMASEIFGNSLDIHSGGIDLYFPHHENEEAQCCAYHNTKQWANYWLHTGHLHVKDQNKMSKSLGNTIGIKEFLEKYAADEFRLFCLQTHYRNRVEYCDNSMDIAVAVYRKFESFFSNADSYIKGTLQCDGIQEDVLMEKLCITRENVLSALSNDFDTPCALNYMMDLINITNKMLMKKSEKNKSSRSPSCIAAISFYIQKVIKLLGLTFQDQKTSHASLPLSITQFNKVLDDVVKFRHQVRVLTLSKEEEIDAHKIQAEQLKLNKKKHILNACDDLRNELMYSGIEVKDRGNSSSWAFVKSRTKKS